jgi:adenylate cyclase
MARRGTGATAASSVLAPGGQRLRYGHVGVESDAQERLTHLLAACPAVVYSFRATGDYAPTFVSENLRDLFGYEPRDYLENADFWRRRVHPDDLAAVEAETAHLFATGRHAVEYRFLRSDGQLVLGQ